MPNQAWDVDAPATARLREAGAVLLGKTSTPEFGCKGETNSPRTGITRNPWDPSKTPGGSSGGTAAAVAAGLGPLSVGTDGAGQRAHPGRVLRQLRLEAELRPRAGVPAVAVRHRGAPGPAHDERARRGADAERAGAARCARLDFAAVRRHATTPWGWTTAFAACASPGRRRWAMRRTCIRKSPPPCAKAVEDLRALGAHVEAVDPGFDDPLEITSGLWFVGAWTLWNTLTRRAAEGHRPRLSPPRPSSAPSSARSTCSA